MARTKVYLAVHLFLIKENQILLLKRFNTGYEDGKYSVCAGHVEADENYIDAMIREAKEEIGIDIQKENLKAIQIMHRKSESERIDYFFECMTFDGIITNCEEDKCDELKWVDIHHLPTNMIPYVSYAIQAYLNQKTFTQFGWD